MHRCESANVSVVNVNLHLQISVLRSGLHSPDLVHEIMRVRIHKEDSEFVVLFRQRQSPRDVHIASQIAIGRVLEVHTLCNLKRWNIVSYGRLETSVFLLADKD